MEFSCSECHFSKEVSDNYAGKKVKCPNCGVSNLLPAKELVNTIAKPLVKRESSQKGALPKIYTFDEFRQDHRIKKSRTKRFHQESDDTLELNTQEGVWIKSGSMISSFGKIKYEQDKNSKRSILDKLIKSKNKGLEKAKGDGSIFVADGGKKISLFKLSSESLMVKEDDILAFEKGIKFELKNDKEKVIELSGTGYVAITSLTDPIVIEVRGKELIKTNSHSTVAWSAKAEFLKDGQLKFSNQGFVIVQAAQSNQVLDTKHNLAQFTGAVALCLVLGTIGFINLDKVDESRKPASNNRQISQIQKRQGEVNQLDLLIKQKGVNATEGERNKLRKLKRSLRKLEEKL